MSAQKLDEQIAPFVSQFDATGYAAGLAYIPETETEGSGDHLERDRTADARLRRGEDQLTALASAIDRELNELVAANAEVLLQQVIAVGGVKDTAQTVMDSVSQLQQNMAALRTRIRLPFEQISLYTRQLEHLHDAAELVRNTLALLQLVRRLRARDTTATSNTESLPTDLALRATILHSINQLQAVCDFSGVDVVTEQLEYVAKTRKETTSSALELLQRGFSTQNPLELATGIQIFYSLGTLGQVTGDFAERALNELNRTMSEALSPASIQAEVREINAARTAAYTAQQQQQQHQQQHQQQAKQQSGGLHYVSTEPVLWDRLDKVLGAISKVCVQIYAFDRVLQMKRDPVTQHPLSTVVYTHLATRDGSNNSSSNISNASLVKWFMSKLAQKIRTALETSCGESVAISKILMGSYPRLLLLFHQRFFATLAPAQQRNAAMEPITSRPENITILRALSEFESMYLQRVQTKVTSAMNAALHVGVSLPLNAQQQQQQQSKPDPYSSLISDTDVAMYVRALASELEQARFDPTLSRSVGIIVSKSLSTFIRNLSMGSVLANSKQASNVLAEMGMARFGMLPAPLSLLKELSALNASSVLAQMLTKMRDEWDAHTDSLAASARMAPLSSTVAGFKDLIAESTTLSPRIASGIFRLLAWPDVERALSQILVGDFTAAASASSSSTRADAPGSAVHTPNMSPSPSVGGLDCSSYVLDIIATLRYLQREIIPRIKSDEIRQGQVKQFVANMIRAFVLMASLAFPMSEHIRLRLTADITQLDFHTDQLVRVATAKSTSAAKSTASSMTFAKFAPGEHKALHSFRTLLFTPLKEMRALVSKESGIDHDLPTSAVVHHVSCCTFEQLEAVMGRSSSKSPPHQSSQHHRPQQQRNVAAMAEIKMPWERRGLTRALYYKWLITDCSEAEAVEWVIKTISEWSCNHDQGNTAISDGLVLVRQIAKARGL
ncbi:hypothetical protein GQ42DRAFT_159989 [Ramicandelaber brevisporus]|nr:hypothetical protein GQ42DRAFT_159989 [Ramicandelaber brevisporus]